MREFAKPFAAESRDARNGAIGFRAHESQHEDMKIGVPGKMRKLTKSIALLFSFLLILAVGGCFAAAGEQATSNNSGMKKSSNNSAASQTQNAPKQNAEDMNKTSNKSAAGVLAPAETLKGTISFIGNSDKEVTLTGADGTPYDFCITRRTMLDMSGKTIGSSQLANTEHKEATLRFVPTARGNMVKDLNISAS
jgi:hypothetical protein